MFGISLFTPSARSSLEGGLAEKLFIAIEELHAMKAIPDKISLSVIQEAVDPTYLREYMNATGK